MPACKIGMGQPVALRNHSPDFQGYPIGSPEKKANFRCGVFRGESMKQQTEDAGLTHLSVSTLCVGDLFAQGSIEVEGSADQREVGKGLREISQRLAMVAGFF